MTTLALRKKKGTKRGGTHTHTPNNRMHAERQRTVTRVATLALGLEVTNGAGAGVHNLGLLDDEAIFDQLAHGLSAVGVGDLGGLVGVNPHLAAAAVHDRGSQPLQSDRKERERGRERERERGRWNVSTWFTMKAKLSGIGNCQRSKPLFSLQGSATPTHTHQHSHSLTPTNTHTPPSTRMCTQNTPSEACSQTSVLFVDQDTHTHKKKKKRQVNA